MGKLPPRSIQHFQHSKPGESTVYGNAITRVLLAAENRGVVVGRSERINVGPFCRFELKLADTAGGGNVDCTTLLPLAKRLASRGLERDNPERTQPINP
ncbi:hypothetical protein [Burkholderia sp. S171]|uniref:hypothetical protein n=1 Tax=Burkholderia sp. S171 TaxID=1641860 RepID=UPI00131B9F9A|nr:hypothetical protein [Burkholderia sp. S171]